MLSFKKKTDFKAYPRFSLQVFTVFQMNKRYIYIYLRLKVFFVVVVVEKVYLRF